ncbi:MAG: hypothetical protein LBV17_10045 [Treponema sp.]|jgi:hypothetical protein|nr:hypothetical protein [Treponema sp.]
MRKPIAVFMLLLVIEIRKNILQTQNKVIKSRSLRSPRALRDEFSDVFKYFLKL